MSKMGWDQCNYENTVVLQSNRMWMLQLVHCSWGTRLVVTSQHDEVTKTHNDNNNSVLVTAHRPTPQVKASDQLSLLLGRGSGVNWTWLGDSHLGSVLML